MTSNFQNRFTNYEFIKSVKSSGFTFTCYKEKVDWEKLGQVDLDRVVHDLDISVLQEHVSTIVRCDLGELRGIDPGLVKLFRLSQLCLEYCIFCQEQLTVSQEQLQTAYEKSTKEIESLHKELKIKKDELKKEVRKRKKLIHQKENIINSAFQCTMCPKAFVSLIFLESHVKRRHQDHENSKKEPREEEIKLQAELEMLRQELLKEKEVSSAAALAAKESQLAREEALWVQVEKTQSEQRARHQAELAELTETFQNQLKSNLTTQQWKPSDTQALEIQHQEQIKIMQLQLERKKEEEIQAARLEAEESWKHRLENLEMWHQAEREKLQTQLDTQQAQEQIRLAALQAEKQEAIAANAIALSQSVPKPASRRQRSEIRSKSNESSTLPHTKQTSSPVSKASKSPPRAITPPPPAPRRRLRQAKAEDDIVVDTSDSPPANQVPLKSAEPIESPPIPAAPVRAIRKTPVVTRTKPMVPTAPSPAPQVPLRSPVRPLISSDSDSVIDQDDQELPQSMEEMKNALKQHPDILLSLKEDVEAHIDVKLAEYGIEGDTEKLSQAEFTRITSLLNHQRKVSKKKFQNYTHCRRDIEKSIQDRLVEHGVIEERVVHEPNIKPSKLKQSGQASNFLARLTHHYHRKGKKKSGEAKMFTSTPVKKTDNAPTTEAPPSILKLSREQLWLGGNKGTNSEPASPIKSGKKSRPNRPLERTQSLPASKAVTFASEEHQTTSPSSSSWDQDLDLPDDDLLHVSKESASANVPKPRERPKSAFQTSATPQQQPMTSASADAEHKTALSFLATALPDHQPSTSGAGEFLKPVKKPGEASNTKKSSADANDNSWDLEDM